MGKVDLNQTAFATEEELKQYLVLLVLEYASKMNEIESDVHNKSEAEPQKDFFPEYKERYLPVFEQYCSKKKRVYGGQASSYGTPTSFDGIENSVEQAATIKSKNKAEVYFKTKNDFDAEYLFVLVRQNDFWRIDSAKDRWYGMEKWRVVVL